MKTKIDYIEVLLCDVMQHWVKDYKEEGKEIIPLDWFIDTEKKKVIVKLAIQSKD